MPSPCKASFFVFCLVSWVVCVCVCVCFFTTLAVGLLDFKVDVVLARLEADFHDQPPGIPAVPNHQVSLQCPTAGYPCSAQPLGIPAVLNRRVTLHCSTTKYACCAQPLGILAVPNRKVSLQCPTANIPAAPNCRVSLQCPITKYPCRAQRKSILAVPNRRVSLEYPTAEYQYSSAHLQCCKEDSEGGQGNVTLLVQ